METYLESPDPQTGNLPGAETGQQSVSPPDPPTTTEVYPAEYIPGFAVAADQDFFVSSAHLCEETGCPDCQGWWNKFLQSQGQPPTVDPYALKLKSKMYTSKPFPSVATTASSYDIETPASPAPSKLRPRAAGPRKIFLSLDPRRGGVIHLTGEEAQQATSLLSVEGQGSPFPSEPLPILTLKEYAVKYGASKMGYPVKYYTLDQAFPKGYAWLTQEQIQAKMASTLKEGTPELYQTGAEDVNSTDTAGS